MASQSPAGQAASAPSTQATTPEALQPIQALIDKGHTADALKQLAALAAAKPVAPGVYRLQGDALYAADRFAEADTAFAAALAQDPHDLESTQMRGLTLFRLGKPGEAIPLLSAAHEWGPGTRVDPSYVLALCFVDTRRYDDARHAFAIQYGFPPDSAPAYLLAARMLFRREFLFWSSLPGSITKQHHSVRHVMVARRIRRYGIAKPSHRRGLCTAANRGSEQQQHDKQDAITRKEHPDD